MICETAFWSVDLQTKAAPMARRHNTLLSPEVRKKAYKSSYLRRLFPAEARSLATHARDLKGYLTPGRIISLIVRFPRKNDAGSRAIHRQSHQW